MARLQDFQSVTPSASNDNLLIVQATGQGLAKIDTVGQKIATDTTISSLNTSSKKIADAINELLSGKASIDDSVTSNTKTWSSSKINTNGLTNFGKISMSGVLADIGAYIKADGHYAGSRWAQIRIEPTNSTGYFGTSSVCVLYCLSSSNYGVAMFLSDNATKNPIVYGQLSSGNWTFKTTTFTTVN